jgi:thiamine pyrophosphate-dependent acetolactate synthase large subunit-like protein
VPPRPATNLTTGLVDADDSIPIVAITESKLIGSDAFQEVTPLASPVPAPAIT